MEHQLRGILGPLQIQEVVFRQFVELEYETSSLWVGGWHTSGGSIRWQGNKGNNLTLQGWHTISDQMAEPTGRGLASLGFLLLYLTPSML